MIIKNPLSTEKAIRLMELNNELVFIVDPRASKDEIKKAVEERFKVKVLKVRTMHSIKGQKKAYVKLSPETPAIDVATKLGLT
ncbi:50S ribosomal protein L23 [Candidatus Woesearchaeota archaeon ex4484_78]|nr:MAG: 50S ribosomal protein L23 [Candidatus Woesearchaeota archaeon ex4484_78]